MRLAVAGVTAHDIHSTSFHQIPALWSRRVETTLTDSHSPKHRGLAHCLAKAVRSGRDVLMRETGKRPWFPFEWRVGTLLCVCEPLPPRARGSSTPPHLPFYPRSHQVLSQPRQRRQPSPLQPLPHAALPWRACTLDPSCKHCGVCTCGLCPSLRGTASSVATCCNQCKAERDKSLRLYLRPDRRLY